MKIQENVQLANYTTMRIRARAKYLIEITSRADLVEAANFAEEKNLEWFVLGGGSNLIANADFDGVIFLNKIREFSDLSSGKYRLGAGEVADEIVAKFCEKNLSGMECLSLIPGTIGAMPVQNVGAYGQEISEIFREATVFDFRDKTFKTLLKEDMKFAYRDSILKSRKNRNYIITDITVQMKNDNIAPPTYPSLAKYVRENNLTDFSPKSIRAAVIAVRNSKLPPIDKIASAGSFFKNPLVEENLAKKLREKFPEMPQYYMPNSTKKIAAGWLIDQAGLRGFAKFGFQIYPKNALVVTNIENGSAQNLAKFKREIVQKVREKFDVELEQEPENLVEN